VSNSAFSTREWKSIVTDFQEPSTPKAVWQLVNTLGLYALVWTLMFFSLKHSWWLTAPLVIVAAGLLVRVFIIFHDCGHGSYFKSRLANDVVGSITGVLVFTSYHHWRWEHSLHHATSGDLDRRGTGDVWTLTVEEYLNSSRWTRFLYRLARNPIVLFVLAPVFLFVVWERFPSSNSKSRERRSVWLTNAAILAMAASLSCAFGIKQYVMCQLAITMISGGLGVWLFYVQHQFDGAYWERNEQWDFTAAALQGSSFYRLPRILQWFSGNIGYHHIHHLSARIPNYNLERCHESHSIFTQVKPITLADSLKFINCHLWDERMGKLVSFREARRQQRDRRKTASSPVSAETPVAHERSPEKTVTGSSRPTETVGSGSTASQSSHAIP
jgi:omega-6 fatty acid desaturase (delta-12 desaturase)